MVPGLGQEPPGFETCTWRLFSFVSPAKISQSPSRRRSCAFAAVALTDHLPDGGRREIPSPGGPFSFCSWTLRLCGPGVLRALMQPVPVAGAGCLPRPAAFFMRLISARSS
jgi:hypothetical protein